MSILRRNKLTSLLLVLAVLFSALGWPVVASACDHLTAPSLTPAAAPAPELSCSMPEQGKPCCCGPKDRGGQAEAPTDHQGHRMEAEQCHCTVQAPPAQPPAPAKVVRLLPAVDVAILPPAPFQVTPPTPRPWIFSAPAIGPPVGPERASALSRAPPACL